MAKIEVITIEDIGVKDRLRPLDEEQAKALAFTIEQHGLINPITVRNTPASKAGKYTLVTGAHRLKACQLLGWISIEAIVVKADGEDAQMLEICENFFRNELSVIDRAAFGERFRELWEKQHGAISSRKARGEVTANLAATLEHRFEEAVAKRLGLSASVAKRLHRIARDLHPELRSSLRGTEHADNQSLLLKLAKMEPLKQRQVAASMLIGKDLEAALQEVGEVNSKQLTEDDQARLTELSVDRALEVLSKASSEARAKALARIIGGMTAQEKILLTKELDEFAPPKIPLLETVASGKFEGLMECLVERIKEEKLEDDAELIALCKKLHAGPEQVNVAIAQDPDWRREAMARATTILYRRAMENPQGSA